VHWRGKGIPRSTLYPKVLIHHHSFKYNIWYRFFKRKKNNVLRFAAGEMQNQFFFARSAKKTASVKAK
jgi:hypothetical protein